MRRIHSLGTGTTTIGWRREKIYSEIHLSMTASPPETLLLYLETSQQPNKDRLQILVISQDDPEGEAPSFSYSAPEKAGN